MPRSSQSDNLNNLFRKEREYSINKNCLYDLDNLSNTQGNDPSNGAVLRQKSKKYLVANTILRRNGANDKSS